MIFLTFLVIFLLGVYVPYHHPELRKDAGHQHKGRCVAAAGEGAHQAAAGRLTSAVDGPSCLEVSSKTVEY